MEEVVLEGGQAPVVHGDAEAPGQQRYEDGHRERDVAETCRQLWQQNIEINLRGSVEPLRLSDGMKDSRSSETV